MAIFIRATLLIVVVSTAEASVDVTVVNEYSLVRNDATSYLKCVSDDAGVSNDAFKRVIDTGSGRYLPPMVLTGSISPESWPGKRLAMFPEGAMKRTGVIACVAEKDGQREEVAAIKIGTSGGIWPDKYTLTISVGETVALRFLSLDATDVIWRHQGQIIPNENDLVHEIERVSTSHVGIYECYKKDPTQSASYRPIDQGIMRLIVRECPAGKWNPPYCSRFCNCRNGGMCNHETGECVCPPGFQGENCETSCGGNRFGGSCQFACKTGGSNYGEDAEECRSRQFCLPDPYGCSCAAGFQGLECNEGCALGSYGADCKQECHCKRPDLCNRFTGSCTMGCAAGWKGRSCQIECEDGSWGENCAQSCHCTDGKACDRITGECPDGRCAPPFSGRSCQTDSLDECMSEPCQRDGTCVDSVLSYECHCVNGTTGINCETDLDDCESMPCLNGGKCSDEGPMLFSCVCADGFTGETCETNIDDCIRNECKNEAACMDGISGYNCSCKSGYIGRFCEDICPPGTFHESGSKNCLQCDTSSYQDQSGQAFCLPCPSGTQATQNASVTIDDCVTSNILNVNASVDSLIYIIVGLLGSLLLAAAGIAIWYYGFRKKKNRLEKVTIRRAW